MPDFVPEHPEALLAETDWLRRLSRQLVKADASMDAEDLGQETLLLALSNPIRYGTWRPWLARVADNLRRRSARRDAGREHAERQSVLAATARTSDATAPTDAIVAEVEIQRQVATAALELAEPYRTAVLLRFWEGLPPRRIAARLGVPTETVRTRLKRGLAILRARMTTVYGDRAAWAVPMAAWSSGTPAGASILSTTAAITIHLGWFMKSHAALALLTLGLLAGGVAWSTMTSPPDSPAAPSLENSPKTASAAGLVAGDGPADLAEAEVGLPSRQTVDRSPVGDQRVLIRGRCHDGGTRAPMMDCAVQLVPAAATLESISGPAVVDTRTGVDGRFELGLDLPAAAEEYRLFVTAAGKATLSFLLVVEAQAPADVQVIDLGDLYLPVGYQLRGRVLDTDGEPRASALVHIHSRGAVVLDESRPLPITWARVRTGSAGRFVFPHRLSVGSWTIRLRYPDRLVADGGEHHLEIRVGIPSPTVDLVCVPVRETIEGAVVDEGGRPVPDVVVTTGALGAVVFGPAFGPRTDQVGRFRIPRLPSDDSEPRIRLAHDEFEAVDPQRRFRWGQHDAKVVVRRLAVVEVEVVDRETGTPIEAFVARWGSLEANGRSGEQESAASPRAQPRRWLRLKQIPRGRFALWIEPTGEAHAPSSVLTAMAPSTRPVRIELSRAVTRALVLVDSGGKPAVGSRVELVQPAGGAAVTLRSLASPRGVANEPGTDATLLLAGKTDAAGRLPLREAPQAGLVLRIYGDHQPVLLRDVVLAEGSDELRVTVSHGATILGRIGPKDVLSHYTVGAFPGMSAEMQNSEFGLKLALGVTLIGRGDTEGRFPSDGRRVPCDAEGRFKILGIPYGTWDVVLECKFADEHQVPLREVLATVRLDQDAPQEVQADLEYLRPATLRGTVSVDGELVRDQSIELLMRRPNLRHFGRDVRELPITVRTDGDGRFEQIVPPATYGIAMSPEDGAGQLDSPDVVVVPAGGTITKNFHIDRQVVRIRIVDAMGQAVQRREFQVWYDNKLGGEFVTDEEGRLSVDPAPSVTFDLRSWPIALATRDARMDYIRNNPYPKWVEALVRVGPVAMPASGEITLRMPR